MQQPYTFLLSSLILKTVSTIWYLKASSINSLLSEESYDQVPSFSAVLAFTNRTCSLMSFVRFYWRILKDFQLLGGILKISKTMNDTVQIGTPPNSWIKYGLLSLSYRAGWLCSSSILGHCCIVKRSCKSVPAIFSQEHLPQCKILLILCKKMFKINTENNCCNHKG